MSASDTVIVTLRKNATAEIRVGLGEFKGYDLVSLRVWEEPRANSGGERLPTKAGFNFSLERIGELIDALQQTKAEAERLGRIGRRDAA